MSITKASILVVEDEQIIAQNIKMILKNLGCEDVYLADSSSEAMGIVESNTIDLILIDINLNDPELDGIDLIFKIKDKYLIPHIFITANADKSTVERAKETSPKGYVVKPFSRQTIYTNVELALFDSGKNKLVYSDKNGKSSVSLNQITHCEADSSYVKVFLINNKFILIRDSLRNLEDTFPEVFIRIHRSIMVNINHIEKYNHSKVTIRNVEFSLGRSFKDSFLNRLA